MTIRVAFVLAALDAGGAERIIDILSRAAIERGWHVTIITFDRATDPIFHRYHLEVNFRRLGLPVGAKGLPRLALMIRRVVALRDLMRSRHFDIIVSFLTKINVLTLLAKTGTGTPVIVSERNNPLQQRSNPFWGLLLRWLYPRAAAIVMLTERSKVCLPVRQRRRARVIPNPMLAPPVEARFEGPPTLVAVGRLNEQKGFDLLLRAFAGIAEEIPDWRLIIWGEGPERSALEQRVCDLGLSGRVTLPGASATPGTWVASASAFVLSSRYEGFANVLAEAMASGLAVAAFDCDFGPRDMITHDVDGLLVAPQDVAALGSALRRLTTDAGLRRRLGEAAVRGACRFEATTVINAWLGLIEANVRHRPGSQCVSDRTG
jgi:glycosyltransferase involved in cell wall biosynthesis